MNVQLIPYGPLQEVLGAPSLSFEASATSAAALLQALHAAHPGLAPWQGRIALAHGESLLAADSPLEDGMQIALIPPVSGG